MLNKKQKIKLENAISHIEKQMNEIIEEYTLCSIDYATSNSISLIDRIKDNLRYFIKKHIENISNNIVIGQLECSRK